MSTEARNGNAFPNSSLEVLKSLLSIIYPSRFPKVQTLKSLFALG